MPTGTNSAAPAAPQAPAEIYQFVVLCLDRANGKVLWQRVARQEAPHEGHQQNNTFASASPVTDGKCLLAYFGSRGLIVMTFEGNLKWAKDFGNRLLVLLVHEYVLLLPWSTRPASSRTRSSPRISTKARSAAKSRAPTPTAAGARQGGGRARQCQTRRRTARRLHPGRRHRGGGRPPHPAEGRIARRGGAMPAPAVGPQSPRPHLDLPGDAEGDISPAPGGNACPFQKTIRTLKPMMSSRNSANCSGFGSCRLVIQGESPKRTVEPGAGESHLKHRQPPAPSSSLQRTSR